MWKLTFCFLFILNKSTKGGSVCNNQLTCGDCIGYEKVFCVWCLAENHEGPRCEAKKNATNWCIGEVYDPPTEESYGNLTPAEQRQLSPQNIRIKTRPGVLTSFNVSYKPLQDYPLDVYYLMDTSYTMERYTNTLQIHSQLLQKLLLNFTNNVKLGIGSFVEKPALPYSTKFHKAYSFQNELSLTSDPDLFKKKIKNLPRGSNWDDPEATFDALMQAMRCTDLIGWRNVSRRIIVVCTDDVYHSAGDGLMVGAYKTNDMKCHMRHNTHVEALTMDYPSVGQINKVAKEESIKIIFAATREVEKAYRRLQKYIHGSVYHVLGEETKNIAEHIKDSYVDLTQNLRLDTSNVPDYIQLTFNPPCDLNDFEKCKVSYRQTKNVTVGLLVKYCPKNKRVKDTVEINLMGLKEKINIELHLHCACDCEKQENTKQHAPQCSGRGNYQCGVCVCNENSYGDKCDCDEVSAPKDQNKCRVGNDTTLCSGRGICKCGECIDCGSRYSGQFCESDDESCPRVRGVMCAGNGRCRGGVCECDDPSQWEGTDCACPVGNSECIAPHSEKVCSDQGTCVCGKCVCNNTISDANYTDIFCDYCKDCSEQRCEEINSHALCAYYKTCNVSESEVTFVDEKDMGSSAWELAKSCSAPLGELCTLNYKYKYNKYTKRLQIILQQQEVCAMPLDYKIPLLSTVGAVVLVGLLSAVLWKVLVDLHDAREYRRFEMQFNSMNWGDSDNPLYRAPGTTFANPAFSGGS